MRISDGASEDLTGKVCVCSIGRLAIVICKESMPWGATWSGIGLDGNGLWYSRRPIVIAESLKEYHTMLDKIKQLGGK